MSNVTIPEVVRRGLLSHKSPPKKILSQLSTFKAEDGVQLSLVFVDWAGPCFCGCWSIFRLPPSEGNLVLLELEQLGRSFKRFGRNLAERFLKLESFWIYTQFGRSYRNSLNVRFNTSCLSLTVSLRPRYLANQSRLQHQTTV